MRLTRLILITLAFTVACSVPLPVSRPFSASVPQGPLTIAVVGDQQRTGTMEVWRERNTIHADLVKQLVRSKPSALVLLGDQVWSGDSEAEWTYFDRIMKPVHATHIPVYALWGNHEYLGNNNVAEQNLKARFPTMTHRYYTVVLDSVAFVMLDTNFDEFVRDSAVKQLRWYKTALRRYAADRSVQAIVVCGHHPPFTNSTTVQSDRILQRYFVPVAERNPKVVLWLSGHSHAYEHHERGGLHFVVSGGGGGPRQFLRTDPHLQTFPDLYRGGHIRPFHYLLLSRQGASLHVEMVPLATSGEDGEVFVCTRASEPQ